MKNSKFFLGVFFVAAFVQVAVPVSMIVRREVTLNTGRQYKFKTAPVDPHDAFRGQYVALSLKQREVAVKNRGDFFRNQKVYAVIEEDKDGFASFKEILRTRPAGDNYIKARVLYPWYGDKEHKITLELPFDRYYMDENEAPKAELAYRENNRGENRKTYITVRVKSGYSVLEELYINDKPVRECIKE